ncbi:MAG: NAD(P)/FAD-dependent oxidoreductase [Acidobacteriota bacterium]
MEEVDVAIVGAGAAGLMAAIFARRRSIDLGHAPRIVALDGAKKIGAKILIAGGGRCNVTHDIVTADDFNGSSINTIARLLRTFDVEATVTFFRELGVALKREETGKLFPTTNRAQTVLDALLGAIIPGSVRTECRVLSITSDSGRFTVNTSRESLRASRVVLASGGRSVPQTGSDGAGYEIARSLGHSITPTFPGLVPLLLDPGHWLTRLSGISAEVELMLRTAAGRNLRRDRGSILFTHFGLSGPLVLDMSRHWIAAGGKSAGLMLSINLVPEMDFKSADAWLRDQGRERPRASVSNVIQSALPERLAVSLIDSASIDPNLPGGRLEKESRRRLAHFLTDRALPVIGDRGFRFAEVTAGGVPLSEIKASTMESRLCPGLFLCGEILDADGRIGGYNFQWAWATGRLAGRSVAESLATAT